MAKEGLKSPRVKLFVALDLPEAVRSGIETWGSRELTDPALRPVPPQSLHVTLAFLGWRPEREIVRLSEIVAAGSAPAPSLVFGQPVQRPERGRPRLFALPVESPGTVTLQAGVEEMLVAARLYKPERRPFWPHVTVARVKREERGSKRPALVSSPPGALSEGLLRPFDGVRITLYRSELQPWGVQYIPLAQVKLPVGRQ